MEVSLLGNTSFTDDVRKMKSRRAGKRAQREATKCPREWTSKELERQKGMVTRPGPKKKEPPSAWESKTYKEATKGSRTVEQGEWRSRRAAGNSDCPGVSGKMVAGMT